MWDVKFGKHQDPKLELYIYTLLVPNGQRKERIKLMQEQLHKLHEILFPDYTSIWVRCGDFIKLHDNFGEHYNSIYSKTENEPSTK